MITSNISYTTKRRSHTTSTLLSNYSLYFSYLNAHTIPFLNNKVYLSNRIIGKFQSSIKQSILYSRCHTR